MMEPIFKPFDVTSVVFYIPPTEARSERETAVYDWLKQQRGRPLNKGTYWFVNEPPSVSQFESAFGSFLEGECYVLLVRGDVGLRLNVFGKSEEVRDQKIKIPEA